MTGTDTATDSEPTFDELAERVDRARDAVLALDAAPRATAIELKDAIEAAHRAALVTIVRRLRDDDRGRELLYELVDDPGVLALLTLHGIVRADPLTRARQTLDAVRPMLQSHGGDVELVEVRSDGVATVRLQGSCNGCSMSAVTLRETVEEALVTGVAEISAIEVLDDEPTAAFIPLSAIGRKPDPGETGWIDAGGADAVALGSMLRVDVDSDSFVVTNIDNRFAAFRNECVHQGLSLDGGLVDDGVLQCPWHGFRYDATSGECLSSPGAQLQQVPLRITDGRVWLRVG